jgi:hypothetical protein
MKYEIGELYQNKHNSTYFICLDKDGTFITRDRKENEFKIIKTKKKKGYTPKRDVTFEKLLCLWEVSEQQLDTAISDVFFRSDNCRAKTPSYRSAQRKALESPDSGENIRLVKMPRF